MSTGLLIVGIHRSGTSALTRVLNLCGAELGRPLLPIIGRINPTGFWEHALLNRVHEELLQLFGADWWRDSGALPAQWAEHRTAQALAQRADHVLQTQLATHPVWAVKDPRLCRLLPLWRRLGRHHDLKVVRVARHPNAVAASLHAGYNMPRDHVYRLWLHDERLADQLSAGLPTVRVTYEALLADWRSVLARITSNLCIDWPQEEHVAAIDAFLRPSMRHHASGGPLPDAVAARWQTYESDTVLASWPAPRS